jgi:hypothetical protein
MDKYDIEGGVDFFSELYKSLDDGTDEDSAAEDVCLITSQPLSEFFVTMKCGHKFNYKPLYFDIKNHKQKFNRMEGSSGRLAHNELRCPYCRTKQTGTLPYYEEFGLPKIHGINYIDPNYKPTHATSGYKHFLSPCAFLTPNAFFDPSANGVVESSEDMNANCKFHKCVHLGLPINCYNGVSSGENYGDEKHYCWSHKKQVIKKYKQALIVKAKEEIRAQKLKVKEEIKQAKEAEKQKAKVEKQQAKETEKQKAKGSKKKKSPAENVVLGPAVIGDISENNVIIGGGCIEILKGGAKKGNPCGVKILANSLCRRHNALNGGVLH